MTTLTFRTDPETDRALAHLTADGTSTSEAIRAALIAADRARIEAQIRAESEELMNDPEDLAEMRAIREDMDALRAW
jgi:hypothetical protein